MAGRLVAFDIPPTMKAAITALIFGALLMGCSHEPPYTAVGKTNNPPSADATFTNPVLLPTSDRTNSRTYSTNANP
jgi:hypothetical protein